MATFTLTTEKSTENEDDAQPSTPPSRQVPQEVKSDGRRRSTLRPMTSPVIEEFPTTNSSIPATPQPTPSQAASPSQSASPTQPAPISQTASPSHSSDATISKPFPSNPFSATMPKSRQKLTPKRVGTYRGFHIVRLIPFTTKNGLPVPEPLSLSMGSFGAVYGDFLLDMSGPRTVQRVHVRNLRGQDAYLPRRMLQDVYYAWGVSPTLEVVSGTGGKEERNILGLPLRRVKRDIEGEGGNVGFGDGEIVMRIRREEVDEKVLVCDFERNAGLIGEENLEVLGEMPWGLGVESGVLDLIWNERKGPQLRMKMGRKRKINDPAGEGANGDEKVEGDVIGGEGGSSTKKRKKIVRKKKTKRVPGTVFVLKTF